MRANIFRAPRLLIVGGGYVGLYSALGLENRLRPGEAEITLVSPESFMVYPEGYVFSDSSLLPAPM